MCPAAGMEWENAKLSLWPCGRHMMVGYGMEMGSPPSDGGPILCEFQGARQGAGPEVSASGHFKGFLFKRACVGG